MIPSPARRVQFYMATSALNRVEAVAPLLALPSVFPAFMGFLSSAPQAGIAAAALMAGLFTLRGDTPVVQTVERVAEAAQVSPDVPIEIIVSATALSGAAAGGAAVLDAAGKAAGAAGALTSSHLLSGVWPALAASAILGALAITAIRVWPRVRNRLRARRKLDIDFSFKLPWIIAWWRKKKNSRVFEKFEREMGEIIFRYFNALRADPEEKALLRSALRREIETAANIIARTHSIDAREMSQEILRQIDQSTASILAAARRDTQQTIRQLVLRQLSRKA